MPNKRPATSAACRQNKGWGESLGRSRWSSAFGAHLELELELNWQVEYRDFYYNCQSSTCACRRAPACRRCVMDCAIGFSVMIVCPVRVHACGAQDLEAAVAEERYADAARLRDEGLAGLQVSREPWH
jgi:hypothetical protein